MFQHLLSLFLIMLCTFSKLSWVPFFLTPLELAWEVFPFIIMEFEPICLLATSWKIFNCPGWLLLGPVEDPLVYALWECPGTLFSTLDELL